MSVCSLLIYSTYGCGLWGRDVECSELLKEKQAVEMEKQELQSEVRKLKQELESQRAALAQLTKPPGNDSPTTPEQVSSSSAACDAVSAQCHDAVKERAVEGVGPRAARAGPPGSINTPKSWCDTLGVGACILVSQGSPHLTHLVVVTEPRTGLWSRFSPEPPRNSSRASSHSSRHSRSNQSDLTPAAPEQLAKP
eukprot:906814-Rhodomonas_salina.1